MYVPTVAGMLLPIGGVAFYRRRLNGTQTLSIPELQAANI